VETNILICSYFVAFEEWLRKWLSRMLLTSESFRKGDEDGDFELLDPHLAVAQLARSVLLSTFLSFVPKSFG